VQIAKALGAEVTGVCSTRNVELVRSLGADHVIDYKHEDFTRGDRRYDVIIDNVGNHPLRAVRRVLEPDGTYVRIGGPKHDRWLGPVLGFLKAPLMSRSPASSSPCCGGDERGGLERAELDDRGRAGDACHRPNLSAAGHPRGDRLLETQRARGKVVAVRP